MTSAVSSATIVLTIPPDRHYLGVLRLLVSGALAADTDPGLVEGLRRTVEEVAQAMIAQQVDGPLETRLRRRPDGPVEIEMIAPLTDPPSVDEARLEAVDQMLALVGQRSARRIRDGRLEVTFAVRHLAG